MNQPTQSVAKLMRKTQPTSVSVFDSIHSIKDWDEHTAPDNIFLQKKYLQVVENNPPDGMQFCYAVLHREGETLGVALFQIIHFNADRSLRQDEKHDNYCFFHLFGNYLKSLVARRVDFDTLVCGNLLLTGEHGFYFNPQLVESKEVFGLLQQTINTIIKHLENQRRIPISLVLCKEFFEDKLPLVQSLRTKADYNEFCIQPNMILPLSPDWKSFDDYLAAMSSKYRTRARRAAKKAQTVEIRELTDEELYYFQPRLYELYLKVARSVGFNVLKINKYYFIALKQQLGDTCRIFGCFDKQELVGFFTTIENYDELEAHFLGFEDVYNPSVQIYLNFLYKIVEQAIKRRSHRVIFARTALEIKSSVGAIPYEMFCYMKHTNPLANRFLTPLLDYLQPKEEWQQRHPFRHELSDE